MKKIFGKIVSLLFLTALLCINGFSLVNSSTDEYVHSKGEASLTKQAPDKKLDLIAEEIELDEEEQEDDDEVKFIQSFLGHNIEFCKKATATQIEHNSQYSFGLLNNFSRIIYYQTFLI